MTYADAIQFLYSLRWFGLKLGLENSFKLAAMAGNPQAKLRFIHVAGTNGKGSTCAMLESIYRAAGLRVGLFTSPHLISFRERIQVNRELIGEPDVVRLVEEMQGMLKDFPEEHHPTFFEVVTVMALRHFAGQQCDLVIWETGLGGRLDATNIVTPLASVITNIQFDHQQWLGHSLAQIAAEKAGIIKPGVPIITTTVEPEALAVLEQTAHKLAAPLVKPQADAESSLSGTPLNPPLPGEHQRRNAALALATVKVLQDQIPIPDQAIRRGLETLHWPGRMQTVKTASGQTIILDGAHNPAGARALLDAMRLDFPGQRFALVLGMLADKDWGAVCALLAPEAEKVFVVPVQSDRAAPPDALRDACAKANPPAPVTSCGSLAEALKRAGDESFVLITGSLYLVGEALEWLDPAPGALGSERRLNEWSPEK
jgi:dihydrofolate synthase / folylpolyglutamate synthase